MADSITQERIDQATPNGGDYSIIYYQDAEGNPTSKDTAKKAEVVEFKSGGKQVFRTYATLTE
ncbi:hypothetical protein I8748_32050 [Nostoc sp. CENA67]|uniref:Uncharacterized protein n=1 Tax=Amazonocrinis nigriterrae CENA67 TaxID=2794033 RepID=A0A8J7I0A0_9NOST|nr:hypothetical protein [Amazonocrinis nigriterrae]MBH8566732.1 hypothetical protein [Amazonocrinis nigriterrae CENA67]